MTPIELKNNLQNLQSNASNMTLRSIVLSGAVSDMLNVLEDTTGLFTIDDLSISTKRLASAIEHFAETFEAVQTDAIKLAGGED